MDTQESINDLFNYAIRLERAAEALYEKMAELFAHDLAVEKFWKQYAEEEHGHALYLERVRSAMDKRHLSEPADEGTLQQVHHCLEKTSKDRLEHIHDLEDAYLLAVEIESSETNAIFDFIITNFSTDQLKIATKFLRTQLTQHATKLEREFPSPYKSRIQRQMLRTNRKNV